MFFKSLRSKSSSSKGAEQGVHRVTSSDARSQSTHNSKGDMADSKGRSTAIMSSIDTERTSGDMGDFEKFLEQSRKDAEREEKKKLKELKEAERRRQEVNMSPWASRM